MTRGTYYVQDHYKRPTNDTSWKSCTCALLIFFVMCILILLLSYPWRSGEKRHENKTEEEAEVFEKSNGYESFGKLDRYESFSNDLNPFNSTEDSSDFHTYHPEHHNVITPITKDASTTEIQDDLYKSTKNYTHKPSIVHVTEPIKENISETTEEYSVTTETTKESSDTSVTEDSSIVEVITKKSHDDTKTSPLTPAKVTNDTKSEKYIIYSPEDEPTENTCNTGLCKTVTSKILILMDHDKDPCTDFYTYSCGGIKNDYVTESDLEGDIWKRVNSEMNKINSTYPNFHQQYKTFYTSCYEFDPLIDQASSLASFQKHISNLGSFCGTCNFTLGESSELLGKLLKNTFPALIDIQLQVNKLKRKLHYAIMPSTYGGIMESLIGDNYYSDECLSKFTSGKRTINVKSAYDEYKECEMDYSSYLRTTRAALEYINAFSSESNRDHLINETLNTLKDDILENIKKTSPKSSALKMALKRNKYDVLNIGKLKTKIPTIEWDDFFTIVVGHSDEKVVILGYFLQELHDTISAVFETDLRRLNNAFLAMYTHNLYRDLVLQRRQLHEKHLHCLKITGKLMSDVTSLLYLDSFNSKNLAKDGKCPIQNTSRQMKELYSIMKNTLMADFATGDILVNKANVEIAKEKMEKLQLVTTSSLLPWKDTNFLIDRFSDTNITKDFIHNIEELLSRHSTLMVNSYGNDPMTAEQFWTHTALPYDTKIKVDLNLDVLVVPMAAVEYLRKQMNIPRYLLMADSGFKMAKEVSFYLEESGIKLYKRKEFNTSDPRVDIVDPVNGQNAVLDIDVNSYMTEKNTDYAAAELAYLVYRRDNESHKDLPLLWLNKNIEKIFLLYMSQQFCTKKPVAESMVDVYEKFTLPPLVRVNSLMKDIKETTELKELKGILMDGYACGEVDYLEVTDSGP